MYPFHIHSSESNGNVIFFSPQRTEISILVQLCFEASGIIHVGDKLVWMNPTPELL